MTKLLRSWLFAAILMPATLYHAAAATPALSAPCAPSDEGATLGSDLQSLRDQTTALKDDLERVLQALGKSAGRVRRLEKDLASADSVVEPIVIPPSY